MPIRHLRLRLVLPVLLSVGPALAAAPPRELLLAGGALAICSDLAPASCRTPPDGARRGAARYRIDAEGIARASDPRLWRRPGAPAPEAIGALLRAAGGSGAVQDVDAVEAALQAAAPTWDALLDVEQAGVLAALEVPAVDAAGLRPAERAFPEGSRRRGGLDVLRAFVEAARARAGAGPVRVAFVTASSIDPMEPVDFYRSAFAALGAEAVWWPIDPALAEARFARGDCAALEALRVERLGLPQRERVYPDLARYQRGYCESHPALLMAVQGVFFGGGDQSRIRASLFGDDGRPNAWWQELREAHASGRLVIAGSSAGSAVQSGAWMLSNGDVEAAVSRAARLAAPPEPGCSRGGRCGDVPEDALTLDARGGLGFAEGAIVDTHFSERARELRLLMALQASGARWGYGADEASALRVRQWPGRREIDAVGAHGGWVMRFDAARRDEVEAWYVAPGAVLSIEGEGVAERVSLRVDGATPRPRRPRGDAPASAFDAGALRTLAQRLAWRCGRGYVLPASPGRAELACTDGARGWTGANGQHGVGPLRLRFERGPTAPRTTP